MTHEYVFGVSGGSGSVLAVRFAVAALSSGAVDAAFFRQRYAGPHDGRTLHRRRDYRIMTTDVTWAAAQANIAEA